jgi:hypothetical protein
LKGRRPYVPGLNISGKIKHKEKLAHHYSYSEGPGEYLHEFRAFVAGFDQAKVMVIRSLKGLPGFDALEALIKAIGEEDVPG